MKKLAIYSSPRSTHTKGLVEYLSKTWEVILIGEIISQTVPNDIKQIYNEINSKLEVKADHKYVPGTFKYLFSHPFRSFMDLLFAGKQFKKVISLRRRAKSVKKIIKELQPDLVYSQQLDTMVSTYLSGFRPYVVTFWGSDAYVHAKEFKYRRLLEKCLQSAKLIHVVNSTQKEILLELFDLDSEKFFIQNFGAKVKEFKYLQDKQSLREKYGFNEQFLLLSARYSKDRDLFRLDLLAQALKILLDEYQLDVRLIYINKADTIPELKKLVKELAIEQEVSFLGHLESEEYKNIISISDLFVQCPLYDSVGVSVMESLAAGVPVISTKVDGAKINVKDSYNGLFLDSREPEEIADKIASLLNDLERLKKYSDNAHKWALEHCDKDIAMKNINSKLESIFNE